MLLFSVIFPAVPDVLLLVSIDKSLTTVGEELRFFPNVQQTRSELFEEAADDFGKLAQIATPQERDKLLAKQALALLMVANTNMLIDHSRLAETKLAEAVHGGIAERNCHITIFQSFTETLQLYLRNRANLLLCQRVEYHGFINAIDEFGAKMTPNLLHHGKFDLIVVLLPGHGLDFA